MTLVIVGHASFENGKLSTTVNKGKNRNSRNNNKPTKTKKFSKHREVKAETVIKKLCCKDCITSYFDGTNNVILVGDKNCNMWITDRNYGVAVSTWDKGGKNFKTNKVKTQKEMYDMLEVLKERVNNTSDLKPFS